MNTISTADGQSEREWKALVVEVLEAEGYYVDWPGREGKSIFIGVKDTKEDADGE